MRARVKRQQAKGAQLRADFRARRPWPDASGAAINEDCVGGYRGRIMAVKITRDVLEGYLSCKYKGRLQLGGEEGRKSDYEVMATDLLRQLRTRVVADLL